MTTLLLRGLAAFRPAPALAPQRASAAASNPAGVHWLTPAIQRNMGVRARRLMRSGD
jgi:hypothetical protein